MATLGINWYSCKTVNCILQFSSVQFSRSVVSDSLPPHELQHARPPCPSPTPGVYSNSCPSSRWCHPAISSSVIPFSSCPESLPASGSFQWVNSSHEVVKVLESQLQHQSFQWTPRIELLWDGLVGSSCSPRETVFLLVVKCFLFQLWVLVLERGKREVRNYF